MRFNNRCRTSGNAVDIFNTFRRMAALGHTYFRVLCCYLSMLLASVLKKKCTLALRWHCGSSLGAVDRLWLLHAHGAGASHWQYGFCVFLLFGAVAKLWETSHKQFGFALLCSSSNEGGKPLTGTLFLHLLVEITAWKKSQDSQCVFHIQPSHLRIRTFKIFILKPFSCFAEP